MVSLTISQSPDSKLSPKSKLHLFICAKFWQVLGFIEKLLKEQQEILHYSL